MLGSPVTRAFAVCEAIAEERARATSCGDFADGYRCAAREIATAIRARCEARVPTPLERELRDAEVEARTLAHVVTVASGVITDLGANTHAAEGIRRVLKAFFAENDLPAVIRGERQAEHADHAEDGAQSPQKRRDPSGRPSLRRERRRAI
jgi:hypothetical protein